MKKVLVTGACGFIGEKVCSGLLKKHCVVVGVDSHPSGYNEGKENYIYEQASPANKSSYADIFDKHNDVDTVIHIACTVDNDFNNIVDSDDVKLSKNCDSFIYKYAMATNLTQFILVSTYQVYSIPKTREPIREDDDIKPITNYAALKYASEKELAFERKSHKNVAVAIARVAPVYSFDYVENLKAKITDENGSPFVYGTGDYGFQFCCVHNLVEFILCYVNMADNAEDYTGVYNVSDSLLITAHEIADFLREHHGLGAVFQRSTAKDSFKSLLFKLSKKSEEKTNYRYLDMQNFLNNNMLDNTKAKKLCAFKWNLKNTK